MTDPNAQTPQDQSGAQQSQQPPQQGYQPGNQQQGYAQPAPPAPLSQQDDIQWASFSHLGGIIGFLPSLIIWLVFKDRGRFTATEAKEALNFQLTMVAATIVLYIVVTIISVLTFGLGGLLVFLAWVPWVLSIIFSIMGFLRAKEGQHYRYPISIRLIK